MKRSPNCRIDGATYHKDRPTDCRLCYYWVNQIEGTQISQDEMFYLKYMKKTDDNREIQNLKRTIEYAASYLQRGNQISYELVNEMHRIILDSDIKNYTKSL